MKRSKLTVVLLAFALFALPVAQAFASGYNLGGEGDKATAMGGAFRAIADDWSAMYWNPAGLAGQKNSITFQFKALMPTTTVNTLNAGMPIYLREQEYSTEAKTYPAGAFGLVYAINDKMTAGFSVFAPTAAGATWKNLVNIDPTQYSLSIPGLGTFPTPGTARDAVDWDGMMMVIDMHPTFAYKVNEQLRVGVGISIKYADITLQTPSPISDGYGSYYYAVGKLEGTGMGFGGNIGVMYDVNQKIHLGATFTLPTTLGISGTMTQSFYAPDLTAFAGMDPSYAWYDGTIKTAEMDGEADFPVPMEAGFGIAYDVNEKLTVGLDISWTNWKTVDVITLKLTGTDVQGNAAEDTDLSMYHEDTIRYSLGASYQLNPKLQLRAGYYYDPSAIPNDYFIPTIPDVNGKHVFDIGAQYMINDKMAVSGYFEYVYTATRKITDLYTDPTSGSWENVPGLWKFSLPSFGVGFHYFFGGAAASADMGE